ncbi:hypothetical protein DEO72_LG3g1527 [Vigna unguiculata]|uniref:Uncharacterized protein n=1 Tax=Vigna unguiculata TaxID=3917 RepID=A0A4D6LEZ4_VIGUN|nr:hypothetical protein DEO72_LG3g1527 [Vigna unguiculata]
MEGGRTKIEEVQEELKNLKAKYEEERVAWEKEKEEWAGERKQLGTWKVRCLDLEKKMKEKINDLCEDNKELKEKYADIESELEDLKKYIIQEHINGFNKGLRHTAFFCKEVDASHPNYDINKDIVDGRLVDAEEMSAEQSVEEPEGEMLILWIRRKTKCKMM